MCCTVMTQLMGLRQIAFYHCLKVAQIIRTQTKAIPNKKANCILKERQTLARFQTHSQQTAVLLQ